MFKFSILIFIHIFISFSTINLQSHSLTFTPEVPFVPNPVILNKCPASSGKSPRDAVVTYKMSKFGPPNAAEVFDYAIK